jgi:DNA-binding beta-propeller fold protein YncE
MASILLSVAGSALGAGIGLSTTGATLLASLGGFAGSLIDQAVFGLGQTGTRQESASLTIPQVLTSSYGRAIPVVYGTARVAGNVVWMSTPRITTITHTQRVRSGKFSTRTVTTGVERKTETDLAIVLTAVPSLLAEDRAVREAEENGEITTRTRGTMIGVRRLWADGELVYDARTFNLEPVQVNNYTLAAVHDGSEDQQPDEMIEELAGIGNVPGFRGLGYILLQDVRISDYGNRIPNYTAEVVASLPRAPVDTGPQGIAEGSDGDIYVVSHLRRTITRLASDTLKVKAVIGAGDGYLGTLPAHPWRMAVSPADGHLWVTCTGDARVVRIDPATGATVASIAVGNYPQDLVFDGSGFVWVSFPTLNRLSKIDPASNLVASNHTVTGGPWALCRGLDGDLWVSCTTDIARINPANGSIRARVSVGLFPWGVAANPVTGHIWVAVNGEDVLRIIDPATDTVIRDRNTGTYPTCVSAHSNDPHGSVAVTLLYGNQVKVYSRTYNQMLEYATVAFPGPCLHRANGDVFVTQTKYDFILKVEGR